MKTTMTSLLAAILAFGVMTTSAFADWVLDNDQSALYFVSIKKTHVPDMHTFKQLSGRITEGGQGSLAIDLGSLDTGIEIRGQRMRDQLFEASKFTKAKITVDLAETGVKPGIQEVKATLDLHGKQQEVPATVAVTETGNTVQVSTVAPIVLNAEDFDLAAGITTLREIAGLDSISNVVPVTFFLSFVKQ